MATGTRCSGGELISVQESVKMGICAFGHPWRQYHGRKYDLGGDTQQYREQKYDRGGKMSQYHERKYDRGERNVVVA